jgi:hypothetical protein
MRHIETDLSRLDEVIAKQYEDKIRGLAKDSIQNSWAARKTEKGKDFRCVFRFYRTLGAETNVLCIEDSGTHGMGNVEWQAFHAHWKSTKMDYQTGRVSRWGQGKTLFLYFSKTNRILTESIDGAGVYRYSARTNVGYLQRGDVPEAGDPSWLKNADGTLRGIANFFPSIMPLNHQGTRVWILNVKNELAEEIMSGRLVEQLSESWWEIIQKHGAVLTYEEYASALAKTVQVMTPKLGEPQAESESDPAQPIPVTNGARMRVLKLVLTKNDVKESLRGIAIQRGGMTVTRYDSASIPTEFKSRVHGYCIPNEELDEELYHIEMANHEGFEPRKSVWIHLRRKLDEALEKFLAPYIRTQTVKPQIDVHEIVKIVNKIVDDYLLGWGPNVPKLPVRFEPWGYKGTSKRFEKDEVLEHKASVKNTTDTIVAVKVRRWVEGGGKHLLHETEVIKIPKKRSWRVELPEIDFKKTGLSPGEYSLKGELLSDKGDRIHARGVTFYLGVEPPQPQEVPNIQTGGGRTWLKEFIMGSINDKEQVHVRNLPYRRDDASVFINERYKEFQDIMSAFSKGKLTKAELDKRLTHYVVNVLLAEAAKEYLMQLYAQEEKKFDTDQIREGKELFDKMWYDFVEEYGIV